MKKKDCAIFLSRSAALRMIVFKEEIREGGTGSAKAGQVCSVCVFQFIKSLASMTPYADVGAEQGTAQGSPTT
jgi:hypothetical protein